MFPLTPDQHHWLEVATEDEGWCSFTSCTPSRSRARTAVANAKCHFVSDQQLISLFTRSRYCFYYCKETWNVYASNINSESMFQMNTGYFYYARLESFAERQYCCINWALKKVSPDRLQYVLQSSSPKCWCGLLLMCNVGTFQALHPYMIYILPFSKYVSKF